MNIKDYLYKNKDLPYWEDEVIEIVNKILDDQKDMIRKKIEELECEYKLNNIEYDKTIIHGKTKTYTELLKEMEVL